jgi:hypothetical protein
MVTTNATPTAEAIYEFITEFLIARNGGVESDVVDIADACGEPLDQRISRFRTRVQAELPLRFGEAEIELGSKMGECMDLFSFFI